MKYSKNILRTLLVLVSFLMVSCKTTLVSPSKPMQDNKIELYKTYTIQTKDAHKQKIEIIRIDSDKIYGKNEAGEMIEIKKDDVREIKKLDVWASVLVGVAAILAVIFIPI